VTEHLTRRHLLQAGAGAGAGLLLGGATSAFARAQARRVAAAGTFPQGVASGFPATNAITLWTRVAGSSGGRVGLEIATDPGFGASRVVHRSTATVDPAFDDTVHRRVSGRFLQPGRQYWYRFSTGSASEVGRFRTARPAGSAATVRIGFFSCQEYIAGYYHAHADMARQDLDLVVCLGDYIYERSFADEASVSRPVPERQAEDPPSEAQTLAEYRRKYRTYGADPDLRRLRAAFPMVAIWDDHEVEDNYADGIPGGATQERRVPFAERKRNGYRAFFEHMPRAYRGDFRIYGSLPLGNVELFLLDTRQYRDDQPCNPDDGPFSRPGCVEAETVPRTLLGRTQKAWLKDRLSASRAPWKVIANQVMIQSLDTPPGNTLNTDAWDGYGLERREVLDHIDRRVRGDVTFVTGDIHTFFAGDVARDGRQTVRGVDPPESANDGDEPVATEFVGGSITSPGIVDRIADREPERVAVAAPSDAAVLANNPHMAYSNQAYKGYGILEAGADLRVSYRAVSETRRRAHRAFTLKRFRVAKGRPVVLSG